MRSNSYWFYQGAYTPAQCQEILNVFEQNPCRDLADLPAVAKKEADVALCRWYKVRHLLNAAQEVALWFNRHHIGFDVYPVTELDAVHLNTYHAPRGAYGWHQDATGPNAATDMKLTVLVNVSTTAYSGGDLDLFQQGPERVAEFSAPGTVVVFPSWIPHQEAEVTAGKRSTAAFWLLGPRLR